MATFVSSADALRLAASAPTSPALGLYELVAALCIVDRHDLPRADAWFTVAVAAVAHADAHGLRPDACDAGLERLVPWAAAYLLQSCGRPLPDADAAAVALMHHRVLTHTLLEHPERRRHVRWSEVRRICFDQLTHGDTTATQRQHRACLFRHLLCARSQAEGAEDIEGATDTLFRVLQHAVLTHSHALVSVAAEQLCDRHCCPHHRAGGPLPLPPDPCPALRLDHGDTLRPDAEAWIRRVGHALWHDWLCLCTRAPLLSPRFLFAGPDHPGPHNHHDHLADPRLPVAMAVAWLTVTTTPDPDVWLFVDAALRQTPPAAHAHWLVAALLHRFRTAGNDEPPLLVHHVALLVAALGPRPCLRPLLVHALCGYAKCTTRPLPDADADADTDCWPTALLRDHLPAAILGTRTTTTTDPAATRCCPVLYLFLRRPTCPSAAVVVMDVQCTAMLPPQPPLSADNGVVLRVPLAAATDHCELFRHEWAAQFLRHSPRAAWLQPLVQTLDASHGRISLSVDDVRRRVPTVLPFLDVGNVCHPQCPTPHLAYLVLSAALAHACASGL